MTFTRLSPQSALANLRTCLVTHSCLVTHFRIFKKYKVNKKIKIFLGFYRILGFLATIIEETFNKNFK